MPEWIELKYLNNDKINKCAVRCYVIAGVEATGTDSCKVYMDDYNHHWTVAEPYEDVMGKIQEVEGPVTIPVAEHFTMEEYELLLDACKGLEGYKKIEKKLKEILEED